MATMETTETSPAAEHIFKVSNNPQLLDKDTKQYFLTLTAKILFLSKRERPDLQEAVELITTIVKGFDIDDYKNIRCIIKYLRGYP